MDNKPVPPKEIGVYLFPEFKESRYEKTKRILYSISNKMSFHLRDIFTEEEFQCFDAWSDIWLEKQAEKDEQEPVDKIELKFKVGDWVVFNNKHQSIYQVEKIEDGYYILRHTHGGTFRVCILHDESLRLWDITKDAKDGDVLVHSSFMFSDFIFIYNNTSILQAYCYYSNEKNRFIIEDRGHHCPWNMQEVMPATKEQRDLLFSKMHKAGYEWDAGKKELKKIEEKPADKVEPKLTDGFGMSQYDVTRMHSTNPQTICDGILDEVIFE